MRKVYALIIIFLALNFFGQTATTIYCFPGQGSDRRIFDSIDFDLQYKIKIIEYGSPEKHMTMNAFAKQLSSQIDTNNNFILLGVSLGGMICVELSEFLKPQKTIIISSAKNSNELPIRYNFQKVIPIYKLLPGSLLRAGARILQPIVEPDRKKNKKTFVSMLRNKKPVYMKRTVEMLINWDRKNNSKSIYHIHGEKDHTLPIKKIKDPKYKVINGSHMMTLTRAKEISKILDLILKI